MVPLFQSSHSQHKHKHVQYMCIHPRLICMPLCSCVGHTLPDENPCDLRCSKTAAEKMNPRELSILLSEQKTGEKGGV